MKQTSEGAREILDRLCAPTPEAVRAREAVLDFIDGQRFPLSTAVSALTWALADLLIANTSPGACWAGIVGRQLQSIVEAETATTCGHTHNTAPPQ